MSDKKTTHFGYTQVPVEEKAGMVAGVFHSVAGQYDLMNDLMSFGVHRVWKFFTIEKAGVRNGHHVLDIAGGTGDLTASFAKIVGDSGRVVLADINESMLRVGRDKLIDRGHSNSVEYVQADAQFLPFPDNSFDCITIAFGLRNVTEWRSDPCIVFKLGGAFWYWNFPFGIGSLPAIFWQKCTIDTHLTFCQKWANWLPVMLIATAIWLSPYECIPIRKPSKT